MCGIDERTTFNFTHYSYFKKTLNTSCIFKKYDNFFKNARIEVKRSLRQLVRNILIGKIAQAVGRTTGTDENLHMKTVLQKYCSLVNFVVMSTYR